jgi:succinoglycan biosynthesis transport protein ExoP
MPQYDFQIADYERIFRKRYKIVVVAIVLATVFSVFLARSKAPVYKASSTVKVDRTNTDRDLGVTWAIFGSWDNIQTQTQVVTSYPVLLKAAKRMKMLPDSIGEDSHPANETVLGTLSSIKGKISASTSQGTNIISLTATSGDPGEARDLANVMALAYKDYTMDEKKGHVLKTKQFVEDQLERIRTELAEVEGQVRYFEESQRIPSIDANSNRIISESTDLENEIKAVEELAATIQDERKSLMERATGAKSQTRPSLPAGETDSLLVAGRMGWVSKNVDADLGITQLNGRLLQQQFLLDDRLSYYKADHPSVRELENSIQTTIKEILAEYGKKQRSLEAKKSLLAQQKASVDRELFRIPANQIEYARLMRKLKVKEELFSMFTERLESVQIAEAGIVDDVSIISMATLPRSPVNKNMAQIVGVGIFLGLIFGIIFAIIREMFDTSIGTIEDVERTLKLAVLAVIPHIQHSLEKIKRKKKFLKTDSHQGESNPMPLREFLVTHFNPKDPTAEAYRILRTNLEYLSFDKNTRSLLVTSATMQEGKSTTIANLAIAFAQQGKKVVLLECNLRRPSLPRVFGIDRGPGTADILIERERWQDCVRSVTDLALGNFSMDEILSMPGLDNFHIISYGHRPPNPTELISSKKMDRLLADLKENFDIVLVDAPPLLPVADSMVLSTKVDGVVLVYMVGKAPRNSLRLAKERLETVQANIMGLVLNDIRPETTGLTYGSYYMYAYTPKDDTGKKRREKPKKAGVPSRQV